MATTWEQTKLVNYSKRMKFSLTVTRLILVLLFCLFAVGGCTAKAPPVGTQRQVLSDSEIQALVENNQFSDLLRNAERYGVYTSPDFSN
jgi:hypothetical protein